METYDLIAVVSMMVLSFMMGMLFESLNSFKKRMKEFSNGEK
jgi:hypothetical protein